MNASLRAIASSGQPAVRPEDPSRPEARLAAAARDAGIGLWEIDLQRDVARWLGDWCERLSLDPCDGERHLARWGANIHTDDLDEVSRRLRTHLAGKEDHYDAEYRIRDKAGRWRWIFERGRVVERAPDGAAARIVGVRMEVDARKEAEIALLEREIIKFANREQQRIGNDLHDGLGQDLTGIALMLRGIGAQLRKEGSAASGDIEDVIGLVNVAIENTRALARGLSPVSAECDGLPAALQTLAARATERYGIPVTFEARLACCPPFDETAATHLYRIAQEALTNALRHSLATAVTIVLAAAADEVRLQVTDNGCGFSSVALENSNGLGLKIMRHRAHMLGGSLTLGSGAAGGAIVRCTYPLEPSPT